jgi:MFS family permease
MGGQGRRGFSCETFLPCDPRRWLHRFLLLFLMCMLSFGSYYVYDNPASLEKTIINVMGVSVTQYALLYSLYSWPNVILSVFGGYLIDRVLGVRLGTLIFSSFVCLGQLVFALGAFVDKYWLMLVGRFVFGLGGENLAVAQNNYAVLWFKGKELNMVFGLLLSVSRIGSTVNMNINQKLYSHSFDNVNPDFVRLGVVLFIGLGFCLLSLLAGVVLGLFDKRAEIITKRKSGDGERISLKDIKDFPLRLWIIFLVCVCYYVTVFPFIGLAVIFLMEKYGYEAKQANLINSLVYIISAAVSPVLGILVDRTGLNLFWLNLGILFTLGAHAMLAFLGTATWLPYFAMVLMGVAYSLLACALWPLVSFIVPEHQLGTAYGIMQAIQNLGLAIVPIVAGYIVDNNGYLMLEVFFVAMLCIALMSGVLLYVLDSGAGGELNKTAWARNREEKEKKAREEMEAEKKRAGEAMKTRGDDSYTSEITPSTAFHIRNRYLSRVGTKMPDHVYSPLNPLTLSYAHVGVLK